MPCSRTAAPLAQCEPRLIGESNTGSWRTQTPSTTIASTEQPTEQWVQTVFFTSVLPGFALAWAFASPIMLSGSCEANAAAPAARPEPLRNVRRSTVFAPSATAARASGFTLSAGAADLRVSSMRASSDLGGPVVLLDVLGQAVAVALSGLRALWGCSLGRLHALGRDRGHGPGAADAR